MENKMLEYGYQQTLTLLYRILIALVLIAVLFGSFKTIAAGHVGVVRTFGAVHSTPMEEGFNLKWPVIHSVEEIDIRLKRASSHASAASKDLQVVRTEVAVQYSLVGPLVPRAYQQIGAREIIEETLIAPAVQESVKAVTARYTAEELVTQRATVKTGIQQAIASFINQTLTEKSVPGAIQLANVAITDFEFSDEFNKAIEEKVRAEQEALKAENEKIRRVTQAEAAAAERRLAAEAEAYQIEQQSVARAEAIRREAAALRDNPDLITLRTVERWDGRLPQITGGQAIPLLNLDGLGPKDK